MPSSRTINRQRKIEHLKRNLNGIIDLLLMDHKGRDQINMKDFKDLSSKVNLMLEHGNFGSKKFTSVGKNE